MNTNETNENADLRSHKGYKVSPGYFVKDSRQIPIRNIHQNGAEHQKKHCLPL